MNTIRRTSLLSLALSAALGLSCVQATERSWSYTYNNQGLIETANGSLVPMSPTSPPTPMTSRGD